MPPAEDWRYFRYNKLLGHLFRHFAGDIYELVHTHDRAVEPVQGVFYTFPDAETCSIRDLYVLHPTREGWWRSAGRVDDVVIFADVKKLNLIPFEAVIEQYPAFATALICGTGRTKPAVLLQPRQWPENDEGEKQLPEEICSSFEQADEAGPVHGRTTKELVVLTKKDKLMARAGG